MSLATTVPDNILLLSESGKVVNPCAKPAPIITCRTALFGWAVAAGGVAAAAAVVDAVDLAVAVAIAVAC